MQCALKVLLDLEMVNNDGNLKKYKSKNPLKMIMIRYFLSVIEKNFRLIDNNELKILDAGCGEGFVTEQIYNCCVDPVIYGVDLSQQAIDYAKKFQNSNINFSVGDVLSLDFEDKEFDVVCSFEVLEHISNPERVLDELFRVSKKYVFLSVPNEPFFCLGNIISGKNIIRLGNPIDHINHFTFGGFRKFLKKHIRCSRYKLRLYNCFVWTLAVIEKIG